MRSTGRRRPAGASAGRAPATGGGGPPQGREGAAAAAHLRVPAVPLAADGPAGAKRGEAGPMAYEALARKWRPKTFDEIVGQGHVTRALAHATSPGEIHHAYLFSGTRGVGKTTFA